MNTWFWRWLCIDIIFSFGLEVPNEMTAICSTKQFMLASRFFRQCIWAFSTMLWNTFHLSSFTAASNRSYVKDRVLVDNTVEFQFYPAWKHSGMMNICSIINCHTSSNDCCEKQIANEVRYSSLQACFGHCAHSTWPLDLRITHGLSGCSLSVKSAKPKT